MDKYCSANIHVNKNTSHKHTFEDDYRFNLNNELSEDNRVRYLVAWRVGQDFETEHPLHKLWSKQQIV